MKKKHKTWLIIAVAAILIIVIAKSFWTPANLMGTQFLFPMAVIGPGEKAFAGDTVEHTFTLINRAGEELPIDTQEKVVKLYKGFRITDTVGNIVTVGCDTPDGSCDYVEEITTPMNPAETDTISFVFTVTDLTPSSYTGNPYQASGMLFKVTQIWSRETNTWSETPEIIDASCIDPPTCSISNPALSIEFDVSTQTPPPTPTPATIWGWFESLMASIWNFIKNLFGWV